MTTNSQILYEALPILIRESLGDNGEHRCVNNSPDIIVQKSKLGNPMILKKYYDRDVSQCYDDTGKMYLYVRLKNTSNQSLHNIYVHLYRNHLGLYNHPRDWEKNKMETEDGKPVCISTLGPKEIYVTPPFLYNKTNQGGNQNCFVAVATRERTPDYSDICTYEKYVQWINKPNVAARNVCVRQNGIYQDELTFSVKGLRRGKPTFMGFFLKVTECSKPVTFRMQQDDLRIDETRICSSPDDNDAIIFYVTLVPSEFEGKLTVKYDTTEGFPAIFQFTMWDLIFQKPSAELEQYYCELATGFEDSVTLTAVTEAIRQTTDIPAATIEDAETAALPSANVFPAYCTVLGGCIFGQESETRD